MSPKGITPAVHDTSMNYIQVIDLLDIYFLHYLFNKCAQFWGWDMAAVGRGQTEPETSAGACFGSGDGGGKQRAGGTPKTSSRTLSTGRARPGWPEG